MHLDALLTWLLALPETDLHALLEALVEAKREGR